MSVWKDKDKDFWRYSFKHQNRRYTGGGFTTKADARAARERHREQVIQQQATTIQAATGFRQVANTYLDWSKKRHSKQT